MSVKNVKMTHKSSLVLGGRRKKPVGLYLKERKKGRKEKRRKGRKEERKKGRKKKAPLKGRLFFPSSSLLFFKVDSRDEAYQAKKLRPGG